MRSARIPLPALLMGALLLTACGSPKADSLGGGPVRPPSSGSPNASGGPSCAPRPSGTAPAATGDSAADPGKDGVRITAQGRDGADYCAEYEVTHHEAQALTFTVGFAFLTDSGTVLTTTTETVPSVRPGRTVKRTVTTSTVPPAARGAARVKITKVRSVPSAEAPSQDGPCPPSGVRVYADDGDAAMGLRAVSLHLENCGTGTHRLNGYPQLQLLDARHKPVDTVTVLRGGNAIATGTGADGEPQPLELKTGERAYAVMVWHNTVTEAGDPVNAPYARVWAEPGAAPVTVTSEFDLGTTGRLGVGPWKKDETRAAAPSR